jgi:molybdopterin-guanine dinucleotide biosynthesis protein A
MSAAVLNGLVLAGGRSTRMKRDKATIEYAGRPQLERAMELITPLVGGRTFVSVGIGQGEEPQRSAFATIADLRPNLGPIAGIEAAFAKHPADAWLVLACDLPFLGQATLRHLIEHRAPGRLATAYRSRFDGKPEPLCAIYEPASRASIEAWIAAGEICPRKWMAQSDVALLDLPEKRALDNVNTPEEYRQASESIAGPDAAAIGGAAPGRQRRRLNVRYFALLREQAGRGAEALQTEARTPQELYAQLQRDRGLQLAPQFLRVAVNDEFGDWLQPLSDGDTVAFLPPVAGG